MSIPDNLQSIGIARILIPGMPSEAGAIVRRPVAGAVVTMRTRDDGHREVISTCITDSRAAEFPLPWLLDQALMPGATRIISLEDRTTLSADLMARRYFVEHRPAALCRGIDTIEPAPERDGLNEMALWQRLEIPMETVSDTTTERRWSRHAPGCGGGHRVRTSHRPPDHMGTSRKR